MKNLFSKKNFKNLINKQEQPPNIEGYLKPETDLERKLLQDKAWRKGVLWGKPRRGHPEGRVLYHIREVLDNVDKLGVKGKLREQLRFITLVHDTFKYKETYGWPRDWSGHHAHIARKFSENYIEEADVLKVIQWHDEAYYCWKRRFKQFNPKASEERLTELLLTIGKDLQLYYLFFKCDTQTGDKTQEPVAWFESTIEGIEIINF